MNWIVLVDICNTNVCVCKKITGVKEKAFHNDREGGGFGCLRRWKKEANAGKKHFGVPWQKPGWKKPLLVVLGSHVIEAKVKKNAFFGGLRMNACYHPRVLHTHSHRLTHTCYLQYSRIRNDPYFPRVMQSNLLLLLFHSIMSKWSIEIRVSTEIRNFNRNPNSQAENKMQGETSPLLVSLLGKF